MNNSATTRRITKIAIEYNGNDKGKAERVYQNNLLSQNPEQQFTKVISVRLTEKEFDEIEKQASKYHLKISKLSYLSLVPTHYTFSSFFISYFMFISSSFFYCFVSLSFTSTIVTGKQIGRASCRERV